MGADFAKTLLYSLRSAADHPTKNTSAGEQTWAGKKFQYKKLLLGHFILRE